jgi:hypothetical protein
MQIFAPIERDNSSVRSRHQNYLSMLAPLLSQCVAGG